MLINGDSIEEDKEAIVVGGLILERMKTRYTIKLTYTAEESVILSYLSEGIFLIITMIKG